MLIIGVILATSGYPPIRSYVDNELLWPASATILLVINYLKGWRLLNSGFVVLGFFLVLVGIHTVFYWSVDVKASIGFYLMLISAFLAASSLTSFRLPYVSVMAAIATVSLLFYIPQQLGLISSSQFAGLPGANLPDGSTHAWLYNFHFLHLQRNSGPFWEPGVFAGYLVVAMMVIVINWRQIPRWQIGVVLGALITTLSTTGFVALLPTMAIYLLGAGGKNISALKMAGALTGLMMLLVVSTAAYIKVPVLGDKISVEYRVTMSRQARYEGTRMGALVYDSQFILKRPLIGWTPSEKPNLLEDPAYVVRHKGSGNGFSGFASAFGLIALGFFFWRAYVSFRGIGASRGQGYLVLLTLVALLQGEQFLFFPLFWCLAMMPREEPSSAELPHAIGSAR